MMRRAIVQIAGTVFLFSPMTAALLSSIDQGGNDTLLCPPRRCWCGSSRRWVRMLGKWRPWAIILFAVSLLGYLCS